MSATTDIVQSVTGVAALAVSVLALRRAASSDVRARLPVLAPEPATDDDRYVPPTFDGAPAGQAPPHRDAPQTVAEWSTQRLVAYGGLGGAAYSFVSDAWLRTTPQRLVAAFVILAATAIALAYVRFGRSRNTRLAFAANVAIGASAVVVLAAFIPPIPPAQSAFGSAVVGVIAVALLVNDRRRRTR